MSATGSTSASAKRRGQQQQKDRAARRMSQTDDEDEISASSWAAEVVATLALFRDPSMARMILIFFYTGFNQVGG